MNAILKKSLLFLFLLIISSDLYSKGDIDDGIKAAQRGDYVKAVELLKNSVKSEDSYDGYYYYGLALMNTGSLKEAEKNLNLALKKDDEGIGALTTMGDLYSIKRDYTKADTYYKRALKSEPENVDVLLARAKNFNKAGKVDDAITALTLATTISKENPKVYVGLGDSYYYRRAYKPAVDNYNLALKIDKNNAGAYYGLGQVEFKKKNYNEALDYYQKSISANPNFADAYLEKGRLLYFNENYDEAMKSFEKYSSLKPGSLDGESYIAKTLYGQKKYDEAILKLQDVIDNNPSEDLSSAYKYMAYVYHDKEEYDKALDYFSKVDKDFIDLEDHIMLAKIYSSKNEFGKAYENINLAISHDSLDDNNYYQLGIIQFNEKKYENQ
ncbi:MAG: tetratricopeptide repeat protein [Ignavibacteria bacterium]|nr:tetratricopeptide repeat protein [Ignavibacteria bacterium]